MISFIQKKQLLELCDFSTLTFPFRQYAVIFHLDELPNSLKVNNKRYYIWNPPFNIKRNKEHENFRRDKFKQKALEEAKGKTQKEKEIIESKKYVSIKYNKLGKLNDLQNKNQPRG